MQKKILVKVLGVTIATAIASSISLMPVSASCPLNQGIFNYFSNSKPSCNTNVSNDTSCNNNAVTNNNTSCGVNILDYYKNASGIPSSVIDTLQQKLNEMLGKYTSPNKDSGNCADNNTCDTPQETPQEVPDDCTDSDCNNTDNNQNTSNEKPIETTPPIDDNTDNSDKTDEPTVPETPPTVIDDEYSDFANEILALVNVERAKEGLQALTLDTKLCNAANVRATEIVTNFSHTRPDGSSCFTAVKDASYTSYKTLGENIAAGQKTPESVVKAWMNSEGHRKNIMSKSFTTLGVGYLNTSSGYGHYWVQMFAG